MAENILPRVLVTSRNLLREAEVQLGFRNPHNKWHHVYFPFPFWCLIRPRMRPRVTENLFSDPKCKGDFGILAVACSKCISKCDYFNPNLAPSK